MCVDMTPKMVVDKRNGLSVIFGSPKADANKPCCSILGATSFKVDSSSFLRFGLNNPKRMPSILRSLPSFDAARFFSLKAPAIHKPKAASKAPVIDVVKPSLNVALPQSMVEASGRLFLE